MKKFLKWGLMVALFTSLTVLMYSCSKDDDEPENDPDNPNSGVTPSEQDKEAIQLEKTELILTVKDKAAVAITKGSGKYKVVSSAASTVVSALSADGKKVELEAKKEGKADVVVTDTKTKKTQTLKVEVLPLVMLDIPEGNKLEIEQFARKELKIKTGSGSYEAKSGDENIALAEVTHPEGKSKEWVVAIEGKTQGECVVTVTDKKTKKTVEIAVTVTPPHKPAYEHLVSGGAIADIQVKDAKMHTGIIVAVEGDGADKAELAIKECDLPFVRVEKLPLKSFVEGKVQEFVLTVAENQDLYPRELKMRLKNSGTKVDFMVKQPASTLEACYNYLAYFALANLKTFTPWQSESNPGAGEFAEIPTAGNIADWNPSAKKFGGYFAFAKVGNKPFKNWRVKIGKYTYKIPSIDELAIFNGEDEHYTDKYFYAIKQLNGEKKWNTALRYEIVDKDGMSGLKVTARYITGTMPSDEDLEKDSFWTNPEKAGSDVIRYFPALGRIDEGNTTPDFTGELYYWSSSNASEADAAQCWTIDGLNSASAGKNTYGRTYKFPIRPILDLDD